MTSRSRAVTPISRSLWFTGMGPRGSNLRALCFGLAPRVLTGALRFIPGVLVAKNQCLVEWSPRRGLLAAGTLVAMLVVANAMPVWAAFEVRDASPAALGAVSVDLDVEPVRVAEEGERFGLFMGASHAALYQVEGLTVERVTIGWEGRVGSASFYYSQVGVPGAREGRARIAVREASGKRIALGLELERLDIALEGEPQVDGWAAGGGVRARLPLGRFDLEVSAAANRLFRSSEIDRLGVSPSVPISIGLRSEFAVARWADRWEGDGRRSPRLVLDVPLARAAWVRFGHGESPGRVGAALGVRLGRVEFSTGRLDASAGGVVSAAALRLLPPRAQGGR